MRLSCAVVVLPASYTRGHAAKPENASKIVDHARRLGSFGGERNASVFRYIASTPTTIIAETTEEATA